MTYSYFNFQNLCLVEKKLSHTTDSLSKSIYNLLTILDISFQLTERFNFWIHRKISINAVDGKYIEINRSQIIGDGTGTNHGEQKSQNYKSEHFIHLYLFLLHNSDQRRTIVTDYCRFLGGLNIYTDFGSL